MIIRSQDKKSIINFNSIDTICIKEDGEIQYYNGEETTMGVLANYSAEEKAIKVLDMICSHADKMRRNLFFAAAGWGGIEKYTSEVFQMPQDSEV